jgi:hypothetical protein
MQKGCFFKNLKQPKPKNRKTETDPDPDQSQKVTPAGL